jgi:hypothetical protein
MTRPATALAAAVKAADKIGPGGVTPTVAERDVGEQAG